MLLCVQGVNPRKWALAPFILAAAPVMGGESDPQLCILVSNASDGGMSVRPAAYCTVATCNRDGQMEKQAFIDGCLRALESGALCHWVAGAAYDVSYNEVESTSHYHAATFVQCSSSAED